MAVSKKEYDELIDVRLLTGELSCVAKRNVIGYCHCSQHKGYITRTLLKSHECTSKQCYHFQKYDDHPYWKAQDNLMEAKALKKNAIKKAKQEEKDKQERWLREAQSIADDLHYPMRIIEIRKTPRKKHYTVFYISDKPCNDWYRFFDFAKEFERSMRAIAELRHIKDLNGNYAMIYERSKIFVH